MTTIPDRVMSELGEAMARGAGPGADRVGARAALARLWDEVGPDGDPFHRCAIAHTLADLQDDVRDELAWDLRALAAADALTDDRVAAGGVATTAAGFYPSLHLNLADAHRRLGDHERAAHHVAAGTAALAALPDDGYRQMIADALARIESRLPAPAPATPP
jgi:hypothetical protein